MNPDITVILFAAVVVALGLLLVGAVVSVAWPERRIWPPPRRRSWQNSLFVWITHPLIALILLVTPRAAEPWLEEQYGGEYREYLRGIPQLL